ncbi:MAG: PRC-barrel domain containing protein [Acidimicrobiales bacterium]
MADMWMWESSVYSSEAGHGGMGRDLVGYEVEATDGSIGKIDEASTEVGRGYVVVDTGWWIFGKKRLVPAGVIRGADHDQHKVFVSCTKDDIKNAPDYDATMNADEEYRERIGTYYRR